MGQKRDTQLAHHLRFTNPGWLIRWLIYRDLKQVSTLASGHMLDVGCGQMPYRQLFPHVTHYTGIDHPNPLHPEDQPTLWADSLALPFANDRFDAALSTQVIEHVPEPALLLAEIWRVLRPGGTLFITAPHIWELHEPPHDYFRYTYFGLNYLLEKTGFQVVQIVPQGGLFVMLAQRISYFVFRLFQKLRLRPVSVLMSMLINSIGFLLDQLYTFEPDTLNYLAVARKHELPHYA
jgi:SAM-dependent methyltransferase